MVGGETALFIRLTSRFLPSTIRCLLFFDLTDIFLLNLQIVFISAHYSLLTFFQKTTLKIESLQIIYLILLLMSWELFRQKLAIMQKINIMGAVFKLPRISIWDAVKGIWRCNTSMSFSFGVLSPSRGAPNKKSGANKLH